MNDQNGMTNNGGPIIIRPIVSIRVLTPESVCWVSLLSANRWFLKCFCSCCVLVLFCSIFFVSWPFNLRWLGWIKTFHYPTRIGWIGKRLTPQALTQNKVTTKDLCTRKLPVPQHRRRNISPQFRPLIVMISTEWESMNVWNTKSQGKRRLSGKRIGFKKTIILRAFS